MSLLSPELLRVSLTTFHASEQASEADTRSEESPGTDVGRPMVPAWSGGGLADLEK